MRKSFSSVFFSPSFIIGVAAVVLNGVLWALVYTLFPRELPAAILHYNVAVGIDFVGEGRQILLLPSVGAALIALDFFLAYMLRGVSRLASTITLSAAVVAQVLLITGFVAILIINT